MSTDAGQLVVVVCHVGVIVSSGFAMARVIDGVVAWIGTCLRMKTLNSQARADLIASREIGVNGRCERGCSFCSAARSATDLAGARRSLLEAAGWRRLARGVQDPRLPWPTEH